MYISDIRIRYRFLQIYIIRNKLKILKQKICVFIWFYWKKTDLLGSRYYADGQILALASPGGCLEIQSAHLGPTESESGTAQSPGYPAT